MSSLPDRETDFELTDLGTGAPPAEESPQEGALTDEEEKLLDELETSLPLTREELPLDGPRRKSLLADAEEVESLAPIDAELDASVDLEQVSGEQLPDLGDSDVEVPLSSDSLPHDETFDDLQALEDELTSAPARGTIRIFPERLG